MIISFKCKETRKIWRRESSTKFPEYIQERALRKLRLLHAMKALNDLAVIPGNRLEALEGNLKGYWSIRINNQWRICFKWSVKQVHGVFIADYH